MTTLQNASSKVQNTVQVDVVIKPNAGSEPWLMRVLTVGTFMEDDGHYLLENFTFAFATRA